MRNTKFLSVVASLVVFAVCLGHMAFDIFGHKAPQTIVVTNGETVELARFRITSDRPIEIRSLTFRVDAVDDLHRAEIGEIICATCKQL